MHPEQIEALIDRVLEQRLGDAQTLTNMLMVLRRTNVRMCTEGESTAMAQNAGILQSLFLSHTNLARVAGNLAEAAQRLQERIVTLESTIAPLQEAVINLQLRVKALEDTKAPNSQ
jgi:hypothetical protein